MDVGDRMAELLKHAERQTKALEGIYALVVVLAILIGAGLLIALVGAYL
jgi:hypothetical protein